jgi:hypothetical protein
MVILGILVGVLLLIGLGFVGLKVYQTVSGTPANHPTTAPANTGTPAGNTGGPSASSSGQLVSTFCEDAKGRQYSTVERILKRDGFKPKRQDVPGPKDIVIELTPCQAVRGSTVTVKVGNGQPSSGSGNGGASPDDNGGGNPGSGGNGLGCSLGIGGGVGCTSGPPKN